MARSGLALAERGPSARPATQLKPALLPAEPWRDAPLTWLGMALDRVALRGMRLAFEAVLHPPEAELEAVRGSAGPYMTPELAYEPRRFFRFLDAPLPYRIKRRGGGGSRAARS